MHRCLQAPEVFKNICEQLDAMEFDCGGSSGGGGRKKHSSVAALAVVCKRLSPLALDVLWRTISSVLPIIRCMPDDLWIERPIPENPFMHELALSRNVVASDWSRALRYIPRVKALREAETAVAVFQSHPSPRLVISPGSMEPLLRSLPQAPLLPNLRSVALSGHHGAPFIPTPYLIPGARLRDVRIQFSRPHPDLSLIYSNARTIRRLEVVKASHRCTFDRVKHMVFQSICALTSLEKLVAPTLNSFALHHLSGLASLKELRLSNFHNDPNLLDFLCTHQRELSFSSLKRLSISGTNKDLIAPFFNSIKKRLSLVQLSIVICTPQFSSDWDSLLHAVVGACSPKSLRTITISEPLSNYFLPSEQHYDNIHSAPLHHLLSFPNLQDVIIAVFALRPNDIELESMAKVWGESLRTLSMSPHAVKRADYQNRPIDPFDLGPILGIGLPNIWHKGVSTLRCLVPFAKFCPNLSHLDLGVELSTDNTNTITYVPTDLEGRPIVTLSSRFKHHTALNLCLDIRFKSDVQPSLATFISTIFHNIVGMPFQTRLLDTIMEYYRTRNRSLNNRLITI